MLNSNNIEKIQKLLDDALNMSQTCVEEEHRNWWDGRANAFREALQVIKGLPSN